MKFKILESASGTIVLSLIILPFHLPIQLFTSADKMGLFDMMVYVGVYFFKTIWKPLLVALFISLVLYTKRKKIGRTTSWRREINEGLLAILCYDLARVAIFTVKTMIYEWHVIS